MPSLLLPHVLDQNSYHWRVSLRVIGDLAWLGIRLGAPPMPTLKLGLGRKAEAEVSVLFGLGLTRGTAERVLDLFTLAWLLRSWSAESGPGLKGLAQAKIIKKSVILFLVLNMTI